MSHPRRERSPMTLAQLGWRIACFARLCATDPPGCASVGTNSVVGGRPLRDRSAPAACRQVSAPPTGRPMPPRPVRSVETPGLPRHSRPGPRRHPGRGTGPAAARSSGHDGLTAGPTQPGDPRFLVTRSARNAAPARAASANICRSLTLPGSITHARSSQPGSVRVREPVRTW